MDLNKERLDLVNENSIPDEYGMEDLDELEENENIYKWLGILFFLVWIYSLIIFHF